MSFNITVEGGSSVRLPTAGKYCDRDIVVTATGGGDDVARSIVDKTITAYSDSEILLGGGFHIVLVVFKPDIGPLCKAKILPGK